LTSQANPQDLPRIGLGATGSPFSPKFSPLFGERAGGTLFSPADDHCSSGAVPITETLEPRKTVGDFVRDQVSGSMVAQNAASLKIVLGVNGGEKCIHILQRPLGAEFSKDESGPCKIAKIRPQSHAAEIGMEVGWIVKSIGGLDVTRISFEEMQGVLKSGMAVLPTATASFGSNSGLELVFAVAGSEKRIHLHRRPLGAEFAKRSKGPTKIETIRPQSYAAELGMEVGWIIKRIGGEDVTKKSFDQTQSALRNAIAVLPSSQ
jgi:hypothetical protein